MAARLDLGQEVTQRLLDALADALPERPLERSRVRRHGGDGLDHLVRDLAQGRPQDVDDLGRQLVPGLISHDS